MPNGRIYGCGRSAFPRGAVMITLTNFEVSAAGRALGIMVSEGIITPEEARRQGMAFARLLDLTAMTGPYINGFRRAMSQYGQDGATTERILHGA